MFTPLEPTTRTRIFSPRAGYTSPLSIVVCWTLYAALTTLDGILLILLTTL